VGNGDRAAAHGQARFEGSRFVTKRRGFGGIMLFHQAKVNGLVDYFRRKISAGADSTGSAAKI
jgi:hypothetical protein